MASCAEVEVEVEVERLQCGVVCSVTCKGVQRKIFFKKNVFQTKTFRKRNSLGYRFHFAVVLLSFFIFSNFPMCVGFHVCSSVDKTQCLS